MSNSVAVDHATDNDDDKVPYSAIFKASAQTLNQHDSKSTISNLNGLYLTYIYYDFWIYLFF